jgi:hypothetical protein
MKVMHIRRVLRQGVHGPGKSWKVLELEKNIPGLESI